MELGSKLMTLKEAVKKHVPDGAHIALGGFTANRNPMAAIYEIIRQRVRNLHLYVHSHGQAMDLLIGAGCVKRIELAYGALGRYAPTCPRFRLAVERGEVEWEDYSNYQMVLRFLAGALDIPFIPTRTGLGTDIAAKEGLRPETRRESKVARRKLLVAEDPFNGGKVLLLPAIKPDVTIIHAQYVGEKGTVRVKGLKFADVEMAKASRHLIVTCEEIVSEEKLRHEPELNCLPGFLVDAVVEVPFGAHPTACYGFYDVDAKHLYMYYDSALSDKSFQKYLEEWVYGVSCHEEYLRKVGEERLKEITATQPYGFRLGLDRRRPK